MPSTVSQKQTAVEELLAKARKYHKPHDFAYHANKGAWQPVDHLVRLSEAILGVILANRRDNGMRRIIVEAPPRHGKSELCSKNIPAWFLARWPDERVMLSSYEANFARSWGRKARSLIEDNSEELGVSVADDQASAGDWGIQGRLGGMLTAGVGGPMTGRGANLLVIDDPIKNAEEAVSTTIRDKHWDWWQSTAKTRIEPGGTAMIIATRWHDEDLSGMVIANTPADRLVRISMPAISGDDDWLGRKPGEALWPGRHPIEALRIAEKETDPFWWESQYQQKPTGNRFSEWPREYFREELWFDDWPAECRIRVIGLDPSKGKNIKSDYSAFVMVMLGHNGHLYVDADLDRLDIAKIVERSMLHYATFKPHAFGYEANGFQESIGSQWNTESRHKNIVMPMWPILNQSDKDIRLRATLTPFLARGEIHWRRTRGTRELVDQMKSFPNGNYDDGPDALEMAIQTIKDILYGKQNQQVEGLSL